jgi:hypothetical protein
MAHGPYWEPSSENAEDIFRVVLDNIYRGVFRMVALSKLSNAARQPGPIAACVVAAG